MGFFESTGAFDVYTDGACSGNPGPGGFGFIIVHGGMLYQSHGSELHTTNNRMEMRGAIEALTALKQNNILKNITIATDSQYLKDGITLWIAKWKENGWKTAGKTDVKNKDLWIALDDLLENMTVTWAWVKGHNGHQWNERVDVLCKNAIVRQKMLGSPFVDVLDLCEAS